MNNEQLVSYIATERARGVADLDIRNALLSSGWRGTDVDLALGGTMQPAIDSGPREFSFGGLWQGRLKRWQYFVSSLALSFLVLFVAMFILFALTKDPIHILDNDPKPTGIQITLLALLYITFIPVSFSLLIRRLHDLNWSGWIALLFLVPLVNTVMGILVLFMRGTVGPNKYGPEQSDRPLTRTLLNT